MEYDKMSDDQLALEVARARGCMIAADLVRPNRIPFCSCPGMPHGMYFPMAPGNTVYARLHRFPRDIAIGFLNSKKPQGITQAYDGVVVTKFVVDKTGQVLFRSDTPPALQNYSFALLMRGAAAEMDDHYAMLADRYSTRKTNFESDNDIDGLLGGADGVGAPGS